MRASVCHHTVTSGRVVEGEFIGYSLDGLACIRVDSCGNVLVIHPSWVTLWAR